MLTVSKDHPLLTTITGSLPRPHWFVANLQGRPFSLAMTDIAFREQYTDAVSAYLTDQTRAGLDLLTDGDARCDCDVGGRSWFAYATERLEGLEGHHVGRGRTASSRDKAAGDIMFEVLETRVLPNVTGQVRRGPLEYSRVWKVAQRQTRKPVKFGAISGQMVATGVHEQRDVVQERTLAFRSRALHQPHVLVADRQTGLSRRPQAECREPVPRASGVRDAQNHVVDVVLHLGVRHRGETETEALRRLEARDAVLAAVEV